MVKMTLFCAGLFSVDLFGDRHFRTFGLPKSDNITLKGRQSPLKAGLSPERPLHVHTERSPLCRPSSGPIGTPGGHELGPKPAFRTFGGYGVTLVRISDPNIEYPQNLFRPNVYGCIDASIGLRGTS